MTLSSELLEKDLLSYCQLALIAVAKDNGGTLQVTDKKLEDAKNCILAVDRTEEGTKLTVQTRSQ